VKKTPFIFFAMVVIEYWTFYLSFSRSSFHRKSDRQPFHFISFHSIPFHVYESILSESAVEVDAPLHPRALAFSVGGAVMIMIYDCMHSPTERSVLKIAKGCGKELHLVAVRGMCNEPRVHPHVYCMTSDVFNIFSGVISNLNKKHFIL
jgi:hypothetical protein